ncbi:MAG: hypothetical protein F6K21_16660 [Symploca sp. SIO2D2]|nr:hypothetical protein [Symploca sp. SIO2D2]
MKEAVLPLETIVFQTLLLLVAIALEARVFYHRLNLGRQISIKYAASINLLAAIISWLLFFLVQNWIPQELETEVINFIFFDRIAASQTQQITMLTVSIGVAIFFITFFIKLKGLDFLQALLKEMSTTEESDEDEEAPTTQLQALANRFNQVAVERNPNQATAVLLANAHSYSGIVLILFMRFFFNNL